ncbi:MAG: hypothetical protein P8Y80_17430 [Acidobacteriota bacterium]
MLRLRYLILGLALVVTFACGATDNENITSEEMEAGADTQNIASTQETGSTRRETPPARSAPPQAQFATLSAGTIIPIRLQDPLDSGVNQSGDIFRAVVDQDLRVGNKVIVPRGSLAEGKLTFVERSGRVSGRAKMSLQLVSLNVDSRSYPMQTEILSFEAEGTKKEDAAKVGIASGVGAAIGAIAGGGKGAAIGAAVGAGAGGAGVAATRGKELQFFACR